MKSLLIHFIIITLGIASSGCKPEETPGPLVGAYIQTLVDIRVTSPSGIDLLDPANPKAFKKFLITYLTDGERKICPIRFGNLGGYKIEKYPQNSFYHLVVALNNPLDQDTY
jgi:hypothetical protein